MLNFSNFVRILLVYITTLQTIDVYSSELSVDANVDARAEYNDNIFLTSESHNDVSSILVTPSLSGVFEEENWQARLDAKIRGSRYSDSDLNGNDQYFDLTGRYNAERNIFSLNANYDLDSNLNSTSTDFGITGSRVNRKNQSASPQYTRLITERLALLLSYTYSDVDYLEAENTGFTPYVSEMAVVTIIYNLSEKDKLSFSGQGVDYTSKNDLITYQLFVSRIGIEHEISETLSTDFSIGVSRRNSTNLNTFTFDFDGNVIAQTQEIDTKDRGFVLDAGLKQRLERGAIEGRVSRDNTTNSFGGLNQVDQFKVTFDNSISSLWRYTLSGRYEDVSAISTSDQATDREVLFFESIAYYSISQRWKLNASYRYIQRKFKSDLSGNEAPSSNRVYVGLTYNFPSLSTF